VGARQSGLLPSLPLAGLPHHLGRPGRQGTGSGGVTEHGYQLTVLVLGVLLVWALLSWASSPAQLSVEHDKLLATQRQVIVLQTQVATLPTVTVRR
jgi:hypothetical protein